MITYLTYIFGLSSFLIGIYLLLLSFKLYKPKHKTEEQKDRYEKTFIKFGRLWKVASIVLILNGSYDLLTRDPNKYSFDTDNKNYQWTSEDREIHVKNCMQDAGSTATDYPEITKDYCECSVDKMMKVMSKEQVESILEKPQAEMINEIIPIIKDCVDELKKGIDIQKKTIRTH